MIEIKKFDVSHIDGVVNIENKCFSEPWSRKSIEEQLKNTNSVYFVLEEDGEVIGYAGMWRIIDEGDINNIGILPDKRRKGYASLLINELIKYMENEKLACLNLEVRASNTPAVALYKKFGFYEVGIRKNYYQGREDALLLRRDRM